MSDTPWTAGPWRVSGAKPTKTRGFDILAGYSKLVASAPAPNDLYRDRSEREANARLIAAAPDLYAAAQAVLDGLHVRIDSASQAGQPVPVFTGIADLHAALARAKGATQ